VASKFQNRLVGTIILVALGVIILPGLLDGQKKHYQDEFAAIPLVPKPGDTDEPDMLPAATQALPSQPPEGAAEEVRAGTAAAPGLDIASLPGDSGAGIDEVPVSREQPKPKPVAEKPKPKPVGDDERRTASARKACEARDDRTSTNRESLRCATWCIEECRQSE
jgi:DedD protein